MNSANTLKGQTTGELSAAHARSEVPHHTAAQCTSLHCPLHVWVCDLNGDLVFAKAHPAPAA